MKLTGFFFFALFFLSDFVGNAQNVSRGDTTQFQQQSSTLNESSGKLIKSISSGKTDEEIAENYYELAIELSKAGNYEKAEQYMFSAIEQINKQKKVSSPRLSHYYRELAKIQEELKKFKQSATNYEQAARTTNDKTLREINVNDASRMRNRSNPENELEMLNRNAVLMNTNQGNISNSEQEISRTYVQMANVNANMNQNQIAIDNYKQALTTLDEYSSDYLKVKGDLASLMAQSNQIEQSIELQKEIISQTQKSGLTAVQLQQMQQLSDLYFSKDKEVEGLQILNDAYSLAMRSGSFKDARQNLIRLADFYESKKNYSAKLKLYEQFIEQLDSLVSNDKSLVDVKVFEINEERIAQLENEKTLKDQLLKKTNKLNYMLIASVFLLLIFIVIIVKAWYSIRKRNKRIALQSLRREMNPHFIFNSLNSINSFIANSNELEANKYLTSYSNLMRKMMENSNNDYISLSSEKDLMEKYMQLEKMRFENKFDYHIEVDSELDADSLMIPNMLIQPNIENAVWHGLRYKESGGILRLRFLREGKHHVAIIEDNGIGLSQSKDLKTKHQQMYNSRGLNNVRERIRLLNQIYKTNISLEISEKSHDESGVIVKISW